MAARSPNVWPATFRPPSTTHVNAIADALTEVLLGSLAIGLGGSPLPLGTIAGVTLWLIVQSGTPALVSTGQLTGVNTEQSAFLFLRLSFLSHDEQLFAWCAPCQTGVP